MNCLVTGAAGFIGSHLCRRLLKEQYRVLGVDSFSDFYPRWIKQKNIESLTKEKNFEFIEKDLNDLDLEGTLINIEHIFHLAAQAGVRGSWGENFSVYSQNNIEATQKLLEASRDSRIKKFIYASSSSVYGFCPELPMLETSPLYPFSPYGVTKLAAEHLCLFGDGNQTRDFTYIDDIVEATYASMEKGKEGEIYNIGGGNRTKLEDTFPILEEICGKKIKVKNQDKQKGDVPHTFANIEKAGKDLDYSPQTRLLNGLKEEWTWIQKLYYS